MTTASSPTVPVIGITTYREQARWGVWDELADVLHAQAADVREAGRRDLIERASRKEILMMLPVVFLVMPLVVVIAFWPGYVGLTLTGP